MEKPGRDKGFWRFVLPLRGFSETPKIPGRLSRNQGVVGSSPTGPTPKKPAPRNGSRGAILFATTQNQVLAATPLPLHTERPAPSRAKKFFGLIDTGMVSHYNGVRRTSREGS